MVSLQGDLIRQVLEFLYNYFNEFFRIKIMTLPCYSINYLSIVHVMLLVKSDKGEKEKRA